MDYVTLGIAPQKSLDVQLVPIYILLPGFNTRAQGLVSPKCDFSEPDRVCTAKSR